MNTVTNLSTRLAGLVLAVLTTVAINGAMLWKFDNVAQQATLARSAPAGAVLTLQQVDAAAPQS